MNAMIDGIAALPSGNTQLTILCPVFNEERVVKLFYDRIQTQMRLLEEEFGCYVTLVFIDNCSSDNTLAEVKTIAAEDSRVFFISLAKNVGYQRSLHCALSACQGDLFVFIDVDCEDPPEMIAEFLRMQRQGYDVVYGERVDRDEPTYIQSMRKLFYRLTKLVADDDIVLDMAEFCLMTNEVRCAILQEKTSFPFIRAAIGRVGFRRLGIPYKRHKRIAGKTHYNFVGMTMFAVTGILSSTTLPLRLPMYVLPVWLFLLLFCSLWYGFTESAWALAAFLFFTAAYVGSTIAFISIYVARTYRNALSHPNSIIRPALSKLPSSVTNRAKRPDITLKSVG